MPDADARFKLRDTVPFDPAVPEDKAKESVSPNDGTRPIVAICETLPRVAVTVALWLPVREPAVATKVAEVEPVETVTKAGTVSRAFVLERVTEEPPVEAAWLRVNAQVPDVFDPKLAGEQVTEIGVFGATRLIAALCETLLRVAVIAAL